MIYQRFLQQVTHLISPPFCAHCAQWLEQRTVLCSTCIAQIQPVVTKTISVTPSVDMRVFAMSDYQEPLIRLVKAKTWSDRTASRQLGELIWRLADIRQVPFDYIVPIPLHWRRYALRGYNQAEEIAQVLSKKSSKSLSPLLRRTRFTALQGHLDRDQRALNVKGVFDVRLHDQKYHGKHLLLVDDVMTSGATLIAAAKALRVLKPLTITAVVACRVVS